MAKSKLLAAGEVIAGGLATYYAPGIGNKLLSKGVADLGGALLSFGLNGLIGKPPNMGLAVRSVDQNTNLADSLSGMPIPYGQAMVGFSRVYMDTAFGNNEASSPGGRYLWFAGALCHGPIHHINSIFIDGVLAAAGQGSSNQYIRDVWSNLGTPTTPNLNGRVAAWLAYGTDGQFNVCPNGYTGASTITVTDSHYFAKNSLDPQGRPLRQLTVASHPFQAGDCIQGATVHGLSPSLGYIVTTTDATHVWVYVPGPDDGAPNGSGGTIDYYTPQLAGGIANLNSTVKFTSDMHGKGIAWLIVRLTFEDTGTVFKSSADPRITVTTSGVMGVDPRDFRSLTVSSITPSSTAISGSVIDTNGHTFYANTVTVVFTASHFLSEGDMLKFTGTYAGTGTTLDGVQRVDRVINGTTIRCFVEGVASSSTGTAGVMDVISNPVIAIREYLTNTTYGVGVPESELDDTQFIAEANVCDTLVYLPVADAADDLSTYTITAVVDSLIGGQHFTDLSIGSNTTGGTGSFLDGDPIDISGLPHTGGGGGATAYDDALNGRQTIYQVLDGQRIRLSLVDSSHANIHITTGTPAGGVVRHVNFSNTRVVTGTTASGSNTILAVENSQVGSPAVSPFRAGDSCLCAEFTSTQSPLNGIQIITAATTTSITVAVTTSGSGTGKVQKVVQLPQFVVNGPLNTNDSLKTNLDLLLSACRGRLVYQAGLYYPSIRQAGVSVNPNFALTKDTIVGGWNFSLPGQIDMANFIRGTYIEPRNGYQAAQVYYPDVPLAQNGYLTADSGQLNIKEIDLPLVNHPSRAVQLMSVMLRESRTAWQVSVTCFESALNLVVDDLTTITHETPGFVAQPFWVKSIAPLMDGTVQVTLEAYDATCYDFYGPGDVQLFPLINIPTPVGGYILPIVTPDPTETADTGMLTLDIVDPQKNITLVEIYTQSGDTSPSLWSTYDPASPPTVPLVEGRMSWIGYRVTATAVDGTVGIIDKEVLPFSAGDYPTVVSLDISFDHEDQTPTVSWVGDSNTQSVRIAVTVNSIISDVGLRGETPINSRSDQTTFVHAVVYPFGLAPGDVVYAEAFAYSEINAGGLESKVMAVVSQVPPWVAGDKTMVVSMSSFVPSQNSVGHTGKFVVIQDPSTGRVYAKLDASETGATFVSNVKLPEHAVVNSITADFATNDTHMTILGVSIQRDGAMGGPVSSLSAGTNTGAWVTGPTGFFGPSDPTTGHTYTVYATIAFAAGGNAANQAISNVVISYTPDSLQGTI